MNSRDVIEEGRIVGLEFPAPLKMRALLDTGASVTAISQTFAKHCKLFQTSKGFEITAIGARHSCGEHAGAISFPGTDLRSFDSIRIISVVFVKEPSYACLLGRDILRHWNITFDGRSKRVTITD
ncbi:MAG TPA: retropepsin-like aspartic protease [Candidatus Angelobacter sp.]|nr:retropepsin-like aspartic protease [Candidatus Angelobacter sp.]